LNELRNALEQQNAIRQAMGRYGYVLIMAVQQQVDIITWHAQLNKSLRAGADIQDAVAHADQAVIDSQGSGMTKDLAAIERGGEWRKLFTVYYGFMNTVLNLEVNALTAKRSLGYKAGTVLMLSVAMPIIDAALSDLLKPGDSDDWDEDHWQASVGKAVANSLTGHFFALRELQFGGRSYSGPTGTRSIADAYKLIEQTRQGELDDGFRRALINIAGSWYGLPSAQINRSWDGFEALDDGKTDNPLALIFGYQEKK
jgi:bbp10